MATSNLALIPSAYNARQLYSVLPNTGAGDFTFARSGNATRTNKDGLIETVDSHVPRLNYDLYQGKPKQCPSLLLEPSRENLVTQSSNTTTGSWGHYNYGGGLMVDTYGYLSPDGTLNASRLVYTNSSVGSGGALLTSNITLLATGVYTISLYAKSISGAKRVRISPKDTGSQGPAGFIIDMTSEWQRFTHTFTNDGGTSRGFQFRVTEVEDSGDRTFDVWGMTIEEGSYATSVIPTNGSTETRNAETCTGAGNSGTFNDSEGVLMVEASALINGADCRITLSDGSISNRVSIEWDALANTIKGFMGSGGFVETSDFNQTLNLKIALHYKVDDFKIFINGFNIAQDTNVSAQVGLNDLSFDNATGSNPFYGNTKQIQYFDTALTDSQLEYLTSYRSFADMVESQNYIIQ